MNKLKTDTEGFLKAPMNTRAVSDEHLIHREYFNPHKFSVNFYLMRTRIPYIFNSGIMTGPSEAVLKPDSFLWLPHGYYYLKSVNGPEMFNLIINFGDQIGIGNKLPSRPEVKTR